MRSLVTQLVLLVGALALTFGALMIVTRRVIKPLHNMRDAMLKVAAGDLHVDTGYAARHDEIGALAGALETFKQQAADKVRIEAQERERNAGATARQQAIESLCRRVREHGAPDAAASSAMPPARCGPPRPACRRFRARPTSASRSPKRPPARPR